MDPFFHLVEQRLEAAVRDGAFDDLENAGRPLVLEDLSAVPEELRSSYILLKSQGFLPPELEAKKAWLRLEDLLAACTEPERRQGLAGEVRKAQLRYRLLVERGRGGNVLHEYHDEIVRRLTRAEV